MRGPGAPGESDRVGKEWGRGTRRAAEDIARNALEASGGVLSGEGSEFHIGKLSLAPAGWSVE